MTARPERSPTGTAHPTTLAATDEEGLHARTVGQGGSSSCPSPLPADAPVPDAAELSPARASLRLPRRPLASARTRGGGGGGRLLPRRDGRDRRQDAPAHWRRPPLRV